MTLGFVDGGVASAVTSGTPGVTTQTLTCSNVTTRTAKAARIWITLADGDDSVKSGGSYSDGFCAGTDQLGIAIQKEDGQATADTSRVTFDDSVIRLYSADGTTLIARASLDAFVAGGVRVVWDTIPTGAYRIHYQCWFGEDLEAAVGIANPPAPASNPTQVNIGFVPQHILTWSCAGFNANETLANGAYYEHGHHVRQTGGSFTSRVFQRQVQHGVATTQTGIRLMTTHASWRLTATTPFIVGTNTGQVTQTYDSGGGNAGFEIESGGTGGAAADFAYLAIRYGAGGRAVIASEVSPNTGSTPVTQNIGTTWTAQAVWVMQAGVTGNWPGAQNAATGSEGFSFGFGSFHGSTQDSGFSQYDQDAVSTSVNKTTSNTNLISQYEAGPTLRVETSVSDWPDSGGVDLRWTTIDTSALRYAYVVIGRAEFTGSGSGNLPLATGAGSGEQKFEGSGAATLPLATGSGSGAQEFTGSGAATLPLATGTGTGTQEFTGSGAATLPLATGAGTGTQEFAGTGAATLPLATGTGSGAQTFAGTGAGALPLATGTGSGTYKANVGSGAATLPLATGAGTASLIFTGTGAGTLPLTTGTGAGAITFTGSGAGTLPLTVGSATGSLTFEGSGAATLPLTTGSGTGSLTFEGSGAATLPLLTATGAGELGFTGTSAGTLPLATGTGTGDSGAISGTGAAILPLATGSGTGSLTFEGSGTATLPLATGSGSGSIVNPITGTGAGTLPLATGSGTANLIFTGTGAGTFPLVTGTGTAELVLTGTGAGTFPLVTGTGSGALIYVATGAGVLPLAIGSGTGVNGELAACISPLLATYLVASSLQGTATRAGALEGQHDNKTALNGQRVLAEALTGTYDQGSTLDGGIC